MNALGLLNENLSEVRSLASLDSVCGQFLSRLKNDEVRDTEDPNLSTVALYFSLKIRDMCTPGNFPTGAKELMTFFQEQGLTKGLIDSIMSGFLRKPGPSPQPGSEEKPSVVSEVGASLELLFPLNSRADNLATKNFGQAILDLNGDFIWADPNSEKFFEIKLKENSKVNFFNDLMIPMSRSHLNKKFNGTNLFKDNCAVGSECTFSYVIYSSSSATKFAKTLNSKNIKDFDDQALNDQKDTDKLSIYYKYLKALSSKATITPLCFRKSDLKDVVKLSRTSICYTEALKNVVDEANRKEVAGKRSPLPAKKQKENSERNNDPKLEFHEDGDLVYQLVIMLDTRSAKNIPAFPYHKMVDDPKILELKDRTRRKLH